MANTVTLWEFFEQLMNSDFTKKQKNCKSKKKK